MGLDFLLAFFYNILEMNNQFELNGFQFLESFEPVEFYCT